MIFNKKVMNLFEVKTKRVTVNESNAYQTVKEQWLVEAETFTEAEANVTKYLSKVYPKDDVSFVGMKPSKIMTCLKSDLCEGSEDETAYYKCTILFMGEGYGRKGTKEYYCVKALGVDDANLTVLKYVRSDDETTIDSVKVEKTKYTGVIVFTKKGNAE